MGKQKIEGDITVCVTDFFISRKDSDEPIETGSMSGETIIDLRMSFGNVFFFFFFVFFFVGFFLFFFFFFLGGGGGGGGVRNLHMLRKSVQIVICVGKDILVTQNKC